MAVVIPLSRLQKVIANLTIAAYNAQVDLFRARTAAGDLPLMTDDITLNISATIIDDVGGKGFNEISRLQKSTTPKTTQVTENISPEEVNTTVVSPEVAVSESEDTGLDVGDEVGTTGASESNNQTSTDQSTQTSTETGTEEATQKYGREVRTENQT
jgi:hypothetical protein